MRIPVCALCLLIAACPVLAQEKGKGAPPPAKKMTEEQKRRVLNESCNREANELKLKGTDRKSFMGGCLGDPAPSAEKANADKAKADKAKADKTNADKTNADKTNADKTNADKANADKANTAKANVDKEKKLKQ